MCQAIRTTLSDFNSRAVDTGRPKSKNIALPPELEQGRCATASGDAQVATWKSRTSGLKKRREGEELSRNSQPSLVHRQATGRNSGHTIFPCPPPLWPPAPMHQIFYVAQFHFSFESPITNDVSRPLPAHHGVAIRDGMGRSHQWHRAAAIPSCPVRLSIPRALQLADRVTKGSLAIGKEHSPRRPS